MVNTNAYLIACAIVSSARKLCQLQPVWTPEQVQLTGLQHVHFVNIEKRIIQKFEQQYNMTASQRPVPKSELKDSTASVNLQPSTAENTQQVSEVAQVLTPNSL